MTKVPIDLPAGLSSIDTSYSTQGKFRSADKVRFRQDRAEVIAGWEAISTTLLHGMCRTITCWKDNVGAEMIAFGTHSNLYVWRAGQTIDITPTSYAAGNVDGATGPGFGIGQWGEGPFGEYIGQGQYWPATWSVYDLGQSLIANPRGGQIYWWQNNASVVADVLSNSVVAGTTNYVPAQVNYAMVTPQRQVLALGCNQQLDANGNAPGPFNPLCLRGSDIDGNIADWGVSNINNSFEYTFANGGLLVAGRNWGNILAIWTQSGLFAGTFTGDTSQVIDFEAVDGGVGLIGPNAACVVGDNAFWVSPDCQIWACEVGSTPQQFYCPIIGDTLDYLAPAQGDKIVVSYCSATNEIRIDYPDSRDGTENSRYFTLYLGDGTSWSQGIMARTAYDRGAPLQWPISAAPMNASNLTTYYYQEHGTSANGGPISWNITTNDFTLDENMSAMFCRGMWPDFINQLGPVEVQFYLRTNPDDAETVVGPYTIQPGQGRVDLRFTAKICRIEFSGSSTPAGLRIGRPLLDMITGGTR